MTMKYFYSDLKKAKPSEKFCTELLRKISSKSWRSVENVAGEKSCRKLGDIKVTTSKGKEIYFDVKDESRWCDIPRQRIGNTNSFKCGKKGTGNLLAEEWIERYEEGNEYDEDGMMRNAHYDYVIEFSWEGKQLLIVDFPRWKEVYDKDEYIFLFHGKKEYSKNFRDQRSITHGYLNPIDKLIEAGVIFARIEFDFDGTKEDFSNIRVTNVKIYDEWGRKRAS